MATEFRSHDGDRYFNTAWERDDWDRRGTDALAAWENKDRGRVVRYQYPPVGHEGQGAIEVTFRDGGHAEGTHTFTFRIQFTRRHGSSWAEASPTALLAIARVLECATAFNATEIKAAAAEAIKREWPGSEENNGSKP